MSHKTIMINNKEIIVNENLFNQLKQIQLSKSS